MATITVPPILLMIYNNAVLDLLVSGKHFSIPIMQADTRGR
jgi:hypothetical protein